MQTIAMLVILELLKKMEVMMCYVKPSVPIHFNENQSIKSLFLQRLEKKQKDLMK